MDEVMKCSRCARPSQEGKCSGCNEVEANCKCQPEVAAPVQEAPAQGAPAEGSPADSAPVQQ